MTCLVIACSVVISRSECRRDMSCRLLIQIDQRVRMQVLQIEVQGIGTAIVNHAKARHIETSISEYWPDKSWRNS